MDGFLDGREIRESLDTANWEMAQSKVRELEAKNSEATSDAAEPVSLDEAGKRFLTDAQARMLHESTIYKYRLLLQQIGDFARRRGLRYLKELDLPTLDDFRSIWKDGPRSSLKKLERLRAFSRFCERRK
jgi:hypothetical protein